MKRPAEFILPLDKVPNELMNGWIRGSNIRQRNLQKFCKHVNG